MDKMKISKEVYDALVEWREKTFKWPRLKGFLSTQNINELPTPANDWWTTLDIDNKENNNRLIAIIRWVNGEDVFEVEKPKKWVVRSKETDIDGDYRFIQRDSSFQIEFMDITPSFTLATRFDTKEEAQSWANAHQEVMEVEE